MQVVILAGGMGTRLSEETSLIPKALVRIGELPILVHIMNFFSSFGHEDFIIAAGYKSDEIKRYFLDFPYLQGNLEVNMGKREVKVFGGKRISWNVRVIDTGINTLTGGRLKRLESFLDEKFFLTYCDGLSDVNLEEVANIGNQTNSVATVTAVHRPSRFGSIISGDNGNLVTEFLEKPTNEWINGGYFYMTRSICDYIDGDETILEASPMQMLASKGLLATYKHDGFWQPMDTLREKNFLQELWDKKETPWRRTKID